MGKINSDLNQQLRVACVGDSITEMSGYPAYTSELLGSKYLLGNFGVCGSQVLLGSDCSYMYSVAFKSAKEFQPHITVIMLGTNDACPNLEQHQGNLIEDYLMLVRGFEALVSKPKIWIAKPPPIFNEDLWLSGKVMDRIVIPAIEQIAKRAKLPLIDVYSALSDEGYFVDGVHPNEKGARVIADVICKAITINDQIS
jgi:acyl-CoA thioesterase-1